MKMGRLKMMILGYTVLAGTVLADCSLSSQDWERLKTSLAQRTYFDAFTSAGDCSTDNPNGLVAKYGDCEDTLEVVLSAYNCRSEMDTLFSAQGIPLDKAKTSAISVCEKTFTKFITGFLCNALSAYGCPVRGSSLGNFATAHVCLIGEHLPDGGPEREEYFTSGDDKKCMKDNHFCKQFSGFQECPNSLHSVLVDMYSMSTLPMKNCSFIYRDAPNVEERCSQSITEMYEYYCPKKSFLEENAVALGVGIPVGLLTLILFVWCVMRMRATSGYIAEDDLIAHVDSEKGLMGSSGSPNNGNRKVFHPELAAIMEKKSKYKGISFDPITNMWKSSTGQAFPTEMEAAQSAYYALSLAKASPKTRGSPLLSASSGSTGFSSMGSFSLPAGDDTVYQVNVPESSEEMLTRRKKQLIAFYEYWDADRQNIPDHVETLFQRHDFNHVARAVKTKFGLLPPGWEEEL